MLRNHFNEYGKITDIRIFPAKNYAFIRLVDLSVSRKDLLCERTFSGLLKSFSPHDLFFVYRYDSHAAAATAICKTNGTEINGSILKVRSLPLSIIVAQFCFF